jgi:hypothetical protein
VTGTTGKGILMKAAIAVMHVNKAAVIIDLLFIFIERPPVYHIVYRLTGVFASCSFSSAL